MQSSYNLVKKEQVLSGKSKVIATEYVVPKTEEDDENQSEMDAEYAKWEEEKQRYISSYESMAKSIIEEARRNREKIHLEALEKAEVLEKEAYEKGYKQGMDNGYEDGKKEAIESIIPEATKEAEIMKERARNILLGATTDYNSYMDSKKDDIIKLSITIAEKILRREVLRNDGINEMIEEAFEMAKGEESIIIRCNEEYVEKIKEKIELWKTEYSITGEVFVLVSDKIDLGNAIIEKNTGKIEVGIDFGLESVKKAIMG